MRAARSYANITGTDFSPRPPVRPRFGKPHFAGDGSPEFSVTHSGGRWLCAFSEQPVGLDIQQRRNADVERLARRFFHSEEAALVAARPDEFFRVWCAKESYVKFTGSGINGDFSRFSTVSAGKMLRSVNGAELRFIPFSADCDLCLCCRDTSSVRFSRL